MIRRSPHQEAGSQPVAVLGMVDLMTSLAVIFLLLFVAIPWRPTVSQSSASIPDALDTPSPVAVVLTDRLRPFGLAPEQVDASELMVVMPEALLNFEFGKSTLSPAALQYVAEVMPIYIGAVCGAIRDRIESIVVEGHTDDLGNDAVNLKLSQARALAVLVASVRAIDLSDPASARCFQSLASASGRGKQDLVYRDLSIDRDQSRRVVIKMRLRAPHSRTPPSVSSSSDLPKRS
jgi:outer membrane protein OmpA-like peptidoglycan-associated protein